MLCATLAARGRLGPRASAAGPSCRLDLFFGMLFFFFRSRCPRFCFRWWVPGVAAAARPGARPPLPLLVSVQSLARTRPTPAAMLSPMLTATAVAAVAKHPRATPFRVTPAPVSLALPPVAAAGAAAIGQSWRALAVGAGMPSGADGRERHCGVAARGVYLPRLPAQRVRRRPRGGQAPPRSRCGRGPSRRRRPSVVAPPRRAARGRTPRRGRRHPAVGVGVVRRPPLPPLGTSRVVRAGAWAVPATRLLALPPRPPVLARSGRSAGAPRAANRPLLRRAPDATASDQHPALAANSSLPHALCPLPPPRKTKTHHAIGITPGCRAPYASCPTPPPPPPSLPLTTPFPPRPFTPPSPVHPPLTPLTPSKKKRHNIRPRHSIGTTRL